jgi:ketosteroid isomerase-like protein
MTSEAREVVERFYDLAAAEEYSRLPDLLDPDVTWFGTRGGLDEGQVFRGPDEVLAYLREILEPWKEFRVELEDAIDTDDGIVVFMREIGQARHGGVEVESETATVFTVRGGKIVEMRGYLDREEALEAVRKPK